MHFGNGVASGPGLLPILRARVVDPAGALRREKGRISAVLRTTLAVVFVAALQARALAVPGDLDRTFGGFGPAGTFTNVGFTVTDVAVDLRGRVVLAGIAANTFHVQQRSGPRFATVKDATIVVEGAQQGARVAAMAIGPAGEIVLVGPVTHSNGNVDFAVVRLNGDDLSLDTGFSGDGAVWSDFDGDIDVPSDVVVQPDGRIVVVGQATTGTIVHNFDWAIERFNQNGTLDSGFGDNGKKTLHPSSSIQDARAFAVALQTDGKIVVAGQADTGTIDPDLQAVIFRLNADGSEDGTFADNGKLLTGLGYSEVAHSVAVAPDGRIALAAASDSGDLQVARFLSTGAPDTDFDGDGRVTTHIDGVQELAERVLVQPDGKILVAARQFENLPAKPVLVRYNPNGSLDQTFGTGGLRFTPIFVGSAAPAVALQPDGMLLVAGTQVARLRSDGTPDDGGIVDVVFDPAQVSGEADTVAIDPDGKLVAAGVTRIGDRKPMSLARFAPDYSQGLDAAFGGAAPGRTTFDLALDTVVTAMTVQSDGKPVVIGQLGTSPNPKYFLLTRFKSDGSPDDACNFAGYNEVDFGHGDGIAQAVTIGLGGKFFVAGSAAGITGSDYAVARFNADCSVDQTYPLQLADFGTNESLGGMVVQTSRRLNVLYPESVVLAGTSSTHFAVNGLLTRETQQPVIGGAREVDPGFGTNGKAILDTGSNEILTGMARQRSGNLIVSGWVGTGGGADFLVARFNGNGVLDTTFGTNGITTIDIGPTDNAYALAVREDDAIVLAGCTTGGAGTQVAVAQLTPDGQLDGGFGAGGKAVVKMGADGTDCGHAVAFLGYDRLVVGGHAYAMGRSNFALAVLETTRDALAPTTTTTIPVGITTSTTIGGGTTTTTLPGTAEICGNCIDDDGDGLTDFEDPDCCTGAAPAAMIVTQAGIASRKGATSLRLSAQLAQTGIASGTTSTQDVFLQLRSAGQETLCAFVPAADLVRKRSVLRFRDPKHAVGSAAGVDRIVLRGRKAGGVLKAGGHALSLGTLSAGNVSVTLGLRPVTAGGGNHCAGGQVEMKANKHGALHFP